MNVDTLSGARRRRASDGRRAATTSNSNTRSLFLPLLALALGLTLAVLGFPRLVAALYAAPATPALEKLDRVDRTLGPSELLRAREALRLALLWERDGRREVDLARVTLALAAREFQAGGDPQPLVGETIEAARLGLGIAPAQARGWLLLAEATLARTGDPGALVPYLLESVRASPYDVWMAPHRAELGLQAWPWLDPEAREAVAGQIRLTGTRSIDRLVDIAIRVGDPSAIREALAADAPVLRRFDILYLRRR